MYGGLKNDHHVLYDKEGIGSVTVEQTIPRIHQEQSRDRPYDAAATYEP